MTDFDHSEKPKKSTEPQSFESGGPWANAWYLHPYTFSSNGDQGQKDSRKDTETGTFPRRSSSWS
jgi:hypothetical protein